MLPKFTHLLKEHSATSDAAVLECRLIGEFFTETISKSAKVPNNVTIDLTKYCNKSSNPAYYS